MSQFIYVLKKSRGESLIIKNIDIYDPFFQCYKKQNWTDLEWRRCQKLSAPNNVVQNHSPLQNTHTVSLGDSVHCRNRSGPCDRGSHCQSNVPLHCGDCEVMQCLSPHSGRDNGTFQHPSTCPDMRDPCIGLLSAALSFDVECLQWVGVGEEG